MSTFAIVETGGKQYRVQAGDTIRVESLPGHEDDLVELGEVLLVSKDGCVTVGTPIVESATVTTELVGHGKSKKIIVFKYKAKTRYRRKSGHRQMYTDLRVTGISV